MKRFNEEIQVTVSVDSIADTLLNTMNPEFKHAELVVESLIGRMLAEDVQGISRLYNALNGFIDGVNFNVGDKIYITDLNKYSYWSKNEEGEFTRSSKDVTDVTVVDINVNANHKIKISYLLYNHKGQPIETTEWVNHTRCSFKQPELSITV
jgi:hypothetical protein